jgi:hypothetical protein
MLVKEAKGNGINEVAGCEKEAAAKEGKPTSDATV